MRLKPLIAAIMLAACGDNLQPPLTWGDAQYVWALSWCQYAERCFPKEFEVQFSDQTTCIDTVYKWNCDDHMNCEEVYPNDERLLDYCVADMETMGCMERHAPDSCYLAFRDV